MSKHRFSFKQPTHWFNKIVVAAALIGIIIIISILIPQPQYKDGFRSLSELHLHAQKLDEWIKMDGKNTDFPNYETYYQKNFPRSSLNTLKQRFNWLLTLLHIKKAPLFSASFFKNILDEVTQYRKSKGWQGDFIQKIEASPSSKIVVFGPVQGSFHGLIRYLEQLAKMNIIDDDLNIKDPNYYFVFLGNVVNRSPYTLEIFSVVLRLLQRNPMNVIYLRGTHECSETWRQHTLRRELEIRAYHLSKEAIPLAQEVDTFFSTLPWTLYCTIPYIEDTKTNYFKCAANIENEKILNMIDAQTYATFLKQKSHSKLTSFNLENRNVSDPEARNITSRALVRGIKRRTLMERINGLKLLAPTKGAVTWAVLSTTAEPIRIMENFFNDSFTIINAAPNLADWTIHLYQRDIRLEKNKNFNETTYFFFSGTPAQIK